MVAIAIPDEVGPKYDCGIVSPTFGNLGISVKPGTYHRDQQLIKRQDVVAALQTALADRDLDFWTRITQSAWNGETTPAASVANAGQGQKVFDDVSSFDSSQGIDTHVSGSLSAVPATVQLATDTTGQVYRGGVVCPVAAGGAAAAFFGWLAGKYIYTLNINAAGPAFLTAVSSSGTGKVLDIATDGATIFFATDDQGIWKTTAAAPGNLVRYDAAGANGPYHRIAWDPLRKKLFAITAPSVGARLEQINAGGAPTVIFDFVNGRLDAICQASGYIFVGWNTGDAVTPSSGNAIVYRYDGSSVSEEHTVGPGQIVSIVNSAGDLRCGFVMNDPFNDPLDAVAGSNFSLLRVTIGSSFFVTAPGILDGYVLQESGTKSPLGSLTVGLLATGSPRLAGGVFYIAAGGVLWARDITTGAITRSFGNPLVTIAGNTRKANITGLVLAQGKIVALAELLNQGTLAQEGGAILQISGSANGNQPSSAADNTLIGSRMDAGLPYVPKYWYAFEVIVDTMPAGSSVEVYYSLDDGLTYTQCGGSPFLPAAGKVLTAVIAQVNNHVKPKVRLLPNPAGGPSPVIHAVSAKFAPSNPNKKIWQLSAICMDNTRLRNNLVDDTSGQDKLTALFNIAQQSETVTFYDANEPLLAGGARPAHTVWVWQAGQDTFNTSGTYSPIRQEGELALVLWEV